MFQLHGSFPQRAANKKKHIEVKQIKQLLQKLLFNCSTKIIISIVKYFLIIYLLFTYLRHQQLLQSTIQVIKLILIKTLFYIIQTILFINLYQNPMNPQLHYLHHVQNTSYSKQTHKFPKAPRFRQYKSQTDFKYNPQIPSFNKSCTFGFGNKVSLDNKISAPSPNRYNVSKFPHNQRTTKIGLSREEVIFGGINTQINKKASLPPPGSYEITTHPSSISCTLKKRLPDQIQIKLKQKAPGPGYYDVDTFSSNGKYPSSKNKNIRKIFIDTKRIQQNYSTSNQGPALYDVLSMNSPFSKYRINQMRKTSVRGFGKNKRKGPEYEHLLNNPGPGYYQNFSPFEGESDCKKYRSKTQYC